MKIEQLEKLCDLKEKGILTQEEFEEEKKKILLEDENVSFQNNEENLKVESKHCHLGKIMSYCGIIIGVIFILISIFLSIYANQDSKNTTCNSASQEQFINIVNNFYGIFRSAETQIQESSARNNRRLSFEKLGLKEVCKWKGVLTNIVTNTNGYAKISIKIADNIVLENYNYNWISPNTVIYDKLSRIKLGQPVVFSGNFIFSGSNNLDYIKENSLTINGSMSSPEFEFNFTDIDLLNSQEEDSRIENFTNVSEKDLPKEIKDIENKFWFGDSNADENLKEKYLKGKLDESELYSFCENITEPLNALNNCVYVYHHYHKTSNPYLILDADKASKKQLKEIAMEFCGNFICKDEEIRKRHDIEDDYSIPEYLCGHLDCFIGDYSMGRDVFDDILEKIKK